MSTDALGDRMKAYEAAESDRRFMPLLPIYARIDGRSFSRFTAGLARPFDLAFQEAMILTTKALVEHTHARIGYTQSDEISLVWQQDRYDSDVFFGGRVQKMCSVLASLATVHFGKACALFTATRERLDRSPHFDCRVFQLPNRTEAANAILWRELDATKNAVSMAARAHHSHGELHGKNGAEMQEMLFARGVNFNDYPAAFKRGTFVRRITEWRALDAEELARIPEANRPAPDLLVQRARVVALEMPRFASVTNREAVIFDGAEPIVAPEGSGA